MRSPNLNVIIKAIDKISGRLARDFGEIENLQNNAFGASKFANACYTRIAESLAADLTKIHPDYNIEFSDGKKIINNPQASYTYLICPVDGLVNLSRAIPYFSVVVALEYKNPSGKQEVINSVVSNIIANELYFCEKGSGAFLNNRRIRVSARQNGDGCIYCLANKNLFKKVDLNTNASFQLMNCNSLDLVYLASGKVDLLVTDVLDQQILRLTSLFLREAGGSINQKDDLVFLSNGRASLAYSGEFSN